MTSLDGSQILQPQWAPQGNITLINYKKQGMYVSPSRVVRMDISGSNVLHRTHTPRYYHVWGTFYIYAFARRHVPVTDGTYTDLAYHLHVYYSVLNNIQKMRARGGHYLLVIHTLSMKILSLTSFGNNCNELYLVFVNIPCDKKFLFWATPTGHVKETLTHPDRRCSEWPRCSAKPRPPWRDIPHCQQRISDTNTQSV